MIRVNDDYWSWKKWAFAHGALINEMTHFADLACCFIESAPVRVTVSRPSIHAPEGALRAVGIAGKVQPTALSAPSGACIEGRPDRYSVESQVIAIEFADGSLAAIFATAFGSFGYPKELVEVYHNGAAIIIDHLVEMRVAGVIDEPFRTVFPIPNDRYPEIEAQGIEGFYQRTEAAQREAFEKGDNSILPPIPDKGHFALLGDFVRCIRSARVPTGIPACEDTGAPSPDEPECSARIAAVPTAIILRALESVERGGIPVEIRQEDYS